jgi:hypothetical protein
MLASIWVGFAINSLCIIWNSNQCGLECKMKGGQIHTSSPTIMNDLQWVRSYFCQEISGLVHHEKTVVLNCTFLIHLFQWTYATSIGIWRGKIVMMWVKWLRPYRG